MEKPFRWGLFWKSIGILVGGWHASIIYSGLLKSENKPEEKRAAEAAFMLSLYGLIAGLLIIITVIYRGWDWRLIMADFGVYYVMVIVTAVRLYADKMREIAWAIIVITLTISVVFWSLVIEILTAPTSE